MFESYKHWMNFSYKIESPRIQFILFLFICSQQKFIWNFVWTVHVRYSLHSMKTCNFWIFLKKNYELFVCIQSVFVVLFLFFCLIFYSFYVCVGVISITSFMSNILITLFNHIWMLFIIFQFILVSGYRTKFNHLEFFFNFQV